MKIIVFAKRNLKEILREPQNLIFGLGFPLVLMFLLSIINNSIPVEANNTMFEINNLAPGLAMFGTAFMALFTGMIVAKDRSSSFLMRLFTSPMIPKDFLLGYTLPLILMTFVQSSITLSIAMLLGIRFSFGVILAIIVTVITSSFFIGLGLLCGTLFSDKTVGGLCGALLTNLAGWLSGVFIPLNLIGGTFKTVCEVLPFYQSVEAIKSALSEDYTMMAVHLGITLLYSFLVFFIGIWVFRKKMKSDK